MKIWNAFLAYVSPGIIVSMGLAVLAAPQASAQAKGTVIEEIVVRVNNSAITLSDIQKAEQSMHEEIVHDCQGCSPEKVDEIYKEKQKDLLRDLIDQALLVERSKDMGISVETDVIKRLDEIRKQNNLGSLEEFEKAVESQGMGWEGFQSSDSQFATDAGSDSPRSRIAYQYSQRGREEILRGAPKGLYPSRTSGALGNLFEHRREKPGRNGVG